jgi:hypothetical protein
MLPVVQRPSVQGPVSLLTPTARAFADGQLQPLAAHAGGLFAKPIYAQPNAQSNSQSPGQQCRRAIANAERLAGIPPHLLSAIARIESGRRDPQTGAVDPWPWSINVEGVDHIYDTKAEVIAAVQMFQAQGHQSIDVGCMQVNLMYHPQAFANLDQAFDPKINADYGAKFLTELYQQTGTWEHATANYHSATPELGTPYERKVIAAFPDEQQVPPPTGGGPLAGLQRLASLGTAANSLSSFPISPGMAPLGMSHVMPMPGLGATMPTGRTLESYRNNPVALARR